jgi:isopropylmalate/homocitrate/citramalate synthase
MKRIKARFKQPVEAHFHMHFGLGVAAGANVAHVTVAGLGQGAGNTPIEDVDFVMARRAGRSRSI